jgi:FG-GAP-like repeat
MKSVLDTSIALLGFVGLAVLGGACSSAASGTPASAADGGGTSASSGSSGGSSSSGSSGSSGGSSDGGSSDSGSSDGGSSDGGSSSGGPIVSSCAPAKVSYGVETIATVATAASAFTPTFVAVDLNNDGAADLVATDRNSIDVVLNKKDGTFGTPTTVPATPGNNEGISFGDFDGDGNRDIIMGAFGNGSVDDSVDVFLGKGDGSFKIPVNTTILGGALYDIQIADFNGDGKQDIYFAGTNGTNGIALNSGGGSFAGPGTALDVPGAPAFGDFNGDKAADVTYFDGNQNAMCVGMNSGSGNFGAPKCYPATANLAATFVRAADLNGDGKPDVVALNENGDNAGNAINVWINKGDGTFNDRVSYSFPRISSAFAVLDVNNDHKADLVVFETYSGGQVNLFLNNGDGTFPATASTTMALGGPNGSAHTTLASGDFLANGLVGFAALKDISGKLNVIATTCKP